MDARDQALRTFVLWMEGPKRGFGTSVLCTEGPKRGFGTFVLCMDGPERWFGTSVLKFMALECYVRPLENTPSKHNA